MSDDKKKISEDLLRKKGEIVLGGMGEVARNAYNSIIKNLELKPTGGMLDIVVNMEIKDDNLFKPDEKCSVVVKMVVSLGEKKI